MTSTETKRVEQPRNGGSRTPLMMIAAAFALGMLAAKVIDWRGHAHPNS